MPTLNALLEISESTPLFPLSNSSPRLTIRSRLEQAIRISGRVFNPFIDAAALLYFTWELISIIQNIIYAEQKKIISDLYIIPLIASTLGLTLSMLFEIHASYKLGKKSSFFIGKNRYELAKILHESLTAELREQENNHQHQYFEQWVEHLKQDRCHSLKVTQLINKFQTAKHYFFIRNLVDAFALTPISSAFLLASDRSRISIKILATISPLFIFILKALVGSIEYNWHRHEKRWKELLIYSRVVLLVSVKGVNIVFNFLSSTALSFFSYCNLQHSAKLTKALFQTI